MDDSDPEPKSKIFKPDDELCLAQSSSSNTRLSSDVESKVIQLVQSNLGDIKKMMKKMYTMQKRTSDTYKVRI